MTVALTCTPAAWALGRVFAEPRLLVGGLTALALVPAGVLWALFDRRLVGGEPAALKPTRFALSIAVYLLSASWTLDYLRPDQLSSTLVDGAVWGLLIGATVELCCITFQAARGRRSHFNWDEPLDAAVSAIMAVAAILFIGMVLPLAAAIATSPRADAPPAMIEAIVAGLVATFVLGTVTGAGIGRAAMSAAGPTPMRLPLLSWTVRGGAARVAHFLGVHAMQAFSIIAAASMPFESRGAIVPTAAMLGYVVLTLMLAFAPGKLAMVRRPIADGA